MNRKYLPVVLTILGVICWASPARAALTINIGGAEFSGSGSATIASNAITLLFEDQSDDGSIAADTVRLTINFNGGTGVDAVAKINEIVFNGEQATVTYLSGSSGTPSPFIQSNPGPPGQGYSSDGDKYYDFRIQFPTSGDTFDVGDVSVYKIVGTGITAGTFSQLADPSDKGPWFAAAQINAVTNGNSGHYGGLVGDGPGPEVPEPATLAIWSLALGFAGFVGKRRLSRS